MNAGHLFIRFIYVRTKLESNSNLSIVLGLCVVVVAFVPIFTSNFTVTVPELRFARPVVEADSVGTGNPIYVDGFIVNTETAGVMVHSSTMTEMPDGELRSVWFQGAREGGPDIALYTSVFDRAANTWSAPTELLGRDQAADEIGRRLKTIGNPVLFTDRSQRTWLFFVTVSFFGWSGGDINFKYSDDSGKTWSTAKRLELSPVPHSGTLIKGTPIEFSDGTIGLPVYRSYDQYSYPELVRLERDGTVVSRVTMSEGDRGGLQPAVTPLSDTDAVAFLRFNGDDPKRILRVNTSDGGQTWTKPVKLDLPNPDSGIAALRLHDGSIILVFNNSTQYRNVLSLAISVDQGVTWKIIHTFDSDGDANPKDERSYPALFMTRNAEINLLYTWKRLKIRHIIFNESWIRSLNE